MYIHRRGRSLTDSKDQDIKITAATDHWGKIPSRAEFQRPT